jgi:MoxR-like ATPase
MRVRVGYPDRAAEKEILQRHRPGEPIDQLRPVLSVADLLPLQQAVRRVRVEECLSDYILDLIEATRRHPNVHLGGSTRAALSLYRAAQALALLEGREYVVPDDIKRLARPVLAHRILTRSFRQGERTDAAERIVTEIVEQTKVPV